MKKIDIPSESNSIWLCQIRQAKIHFGVVDAPKKLLADDVDSQHLVEWNLGGVHQQLGHLQHALFNHTIQKCR